MQGCKDAGEGVFELDFVQLRRYGSRVTKES